MSDQINVSEIELRCLIAERLRGIAHDLDGNGNFAQGAFVPGINTVRENALMQIDDVRALIDRLRFDAEHTIVTRIPVPPLNTLEINIAEFMREGAPERPTENA